MFTGAEVLHEIYTVHHTDVTEELCPGYILVAATRFDDRLLTDHPLPFNLPEHIVGIADMPMPPQELDLLFFFVSDRDAIGMDEALFQGIGMLSLVKCLYTYSNSGSNQGLHLLRIERSNIVGLWQFVKWHGGDFEFGMNAELQPRVRCNTGKRPLNLGD